MCGIVGFIGSKPAEQYLVAGLERMEYRGYDSAGIVMVRQGKLNRIRVKGKIEQLKKQIEKHPDNVTKIGIGHTRWATHGKPSVKNAHPHIANKIAIVHNGIVENHMLLRQQLIKSGAVFHSETDSEVLAWLVEKYYKDSSLESAVCRALPEVEGAFGLIVVAADDPNTLVVARRSSPIAIGQNGDDVYIASDATALAGYVKDVIYLEDDQIAVCTTGSVQIKTLSGREQHITKTKLHMAVSTLQKQGHKHFLIKEISEQPEAVRSVLRGRIVSKRATSQLGGLNVPSATLRECQHIVLVGCGTAYYAGLFAKYMLERLTGVSVSVEMASELRYRQAVLPPHTIGIAISQSGETADTLAAIRELKSHNVPVLGVVNVVGSSIARAVDGGVYLHAGPEISVASTKAFTTQVIALLLFGLNLAAHKKHATKARLDLVAALERLPSEIEEILELKPVIAKRATLWKNYEHAFYLGRDSLYPIALEGSHKLKEISYIHAEAYPAGEMKHGANALIDEKLITVFLLEDGPLFAKSLSNLAEVEARAGKVIVVTNSLQYAREHKDALFAKTSSAWTSPLVLNVVLQLIAYYVALARHCEIDQPRNLAKSVTVE